jgi:hypothetical protein
MDGIMWSAEQSENAKDYRIDIAKWAERAGQAG